METKNNQRKLESLRRNIGGFNFFSYISLVGIAGGMAIWWKDECDIAIWDKSEFGFSLHCHFNPMRYSFAISFIHAPTDLDERASLWDCLLNLTSNSYFP